MVAAAVVGATVVTGVYSANQQGEASDAAVGAQERASERATRESARQFDLVREDTRIARETGNQAMTALGFLMGTRQPPSMEQIGSMQEELKGLQGELKEMRNPTAPSINAFTSRDGITRGASTVTVRDRAAEGSIRHRIEELTQQIESAEQERNMAMEMGGGRGQVPDLNALFEGVELPTGANIGSPDEYLPDLDNFLQGLGKDLENSRGYQFELKQGREALQSTLTQKGTAYGGNAIKEALEYSQDYASTKYGERHGQALQEYDREYQAGMTRYGMDIDEYGRERQQALDKYGLNMDKYRLEKEQSDDYRSTLMTMSGYGPAGTQVSAQAGQNYAQTVASANQNMATTVGNAAYANAGANTQALSNAVNTGMTMYQYNRMMDTMGG